LEKLKHVTGKINPLTQQPIVPLSLLVGFAVVGLLVAFASLLVSGALGIVGWAALGVGALALVALAVLAPRTVLSAFSGRSFRFGGTSVLVTVVLLGALIAAYVIIANFEVVWDVTGNDEFKFNTQAQEAITALGADPNIQAIELIAFYDSSLRSKSKNAVNSCSKITSTTATTKLAIASGDPDR
jgi:hypothetical protein